MIPKQPTKAHTILAKHDFKLVDVNGLKQPLLKWFTLASWLGTPTLFMDGKKYPKQGFTKVDPEKYFVPDEAKELMKKKQDAKTKVVAEVAPVIETTTDDITTALLAGTAAKYPVAELVKYVEDFGLSIENPGSLPKSDLIKRITELI